MTQLEHETTRTDVARWSRVVIAGLVSIAIWVPGGEYGIAVWGRPDVPAQFRGATRLVIEVEAVDGPGYPVLTGVRVAITRR